MCGRGSGVACEAGRKPPAEGGDQDGGGLAGRGPGAAGGPPCEGGGGDRGGRPLFRVRPGDSESLRGRPLSGCRSHAPLPPCPPLSTHHVPSHGVCEDEDGRRGEGGREGGREGGMEGQQRALRKFRKLRALCRVYTREHKHMRLRTHTGASALACARSSTVGTMSVQ